VHFLCYSSLLSNEYRGSIPGGKARPGRDSDHSPSSSAEVKNEKEYTPLPLGAYMAVAGHFVMNNDAFFLRSAACFIC
jgi:hypothetical protein